MTFDHGTYRCGNYSKEETIQGRKLFAEIRYLNLQQFPNLKKRIVAKEKKGCCKNKNVFFPMKTIRKDDQPLIVSRVDLFLFDLLFPNHNIPPKIVLRQKKMS